MNPQESEKGAGPSWRSEFPITQSEEFVVSRRGFGVMCCGAGAAGIAGFAIAAALPRAPHVPWFTACAFDELAPGSDRIVLSPDSGEPILLIHLPSGELRAYSQQCTHLLCPVHYDAEKNHVFCPCHHGVFAVADGKPVAGPPRRALPRYRVEVRDGMICIGTGEIRDEG